MQFHRFENTSRPTVQVLIDTLLEMKTGVIGSFYDSFHRLGGTSQGTANSWIFPKYVTSDIIEEIIRNTCFECGGLMEDSKALQNTLVSSDDFGNDAGKRGTTQSRVGPAKQITVRKCTTCGHSHT